MRVKFKENILHKGLVEFIENCELPTEMAIFQLHAFKENLTNKEHLAITLGKFKNNEPVWFGCDVGKMFLRDLGVMYEGLYKYDLLFGVDFDIVIERKNSRKSFNIIILFIINILMLNS